MTWSTCPGSKATSSPSSPKPGWRATRSPSASCSAAGLAGGDHLLDLAGALADRQDLGVAIEAASGVHLDDAVAAMDLHRLLGRPHRERAGDQLGLGGGQG